MAENVEPFPDGPHVDLKTGNFTESVKDWFRKFATGQQGNATDIGGIISGFNQALETQANQLANEATARAAGDAAVAGSGDGTGTSNSTTFSGKTSSGTTWVPLATVTVTPTGAGNYTFAPYADLPTGHLDNESPLGATFNGNWRIVEEENGGGTPVTVDSGAFSISYTAAQVTGGEGGEPIRIPAFWITTFTGLPSASDTFANTYDSIPVDLRFEIQRASGTNEISQVSGSGGLSGSFGVSWA